jgi:hypothetical protein
MLARRQVQSGAIRAAVYVLGRAPCLGCGYSPLGLCGIELAQNVFCNAADLAAIG